MKKRSLLFCLLSSALVVFVLLSGVGSAQAQTGFGTYGFYYGSPQHLVICENASAVNIDTLMAVADPSTGDTDTWAVIVTPRGSLTATYSATGTGGTITPTGRSYTPPAGFSGMDTFKVRVIDHMGDTDITTVYVTVNPLPLVSAITGLSSVCVAASVSYTDTATGGSWYSLTPAVATVSSSGLVSGVSAGSDVIIFVKSTSSCGSDTVRHSITVNPLAVAGTITGAATICTGISVTLSDTATGGTWSSTDTSRATVTSGGVVTTRRGGTDTIKYSVINSCGVVSARYPITIVPVPYSGIITGSDSVCAGSATVLADSASGGTWSSVTTRVAIVGTSGIVIGVSPGTDTIKYTYTNSCGTVYSTHFITVNPLPYAGSIAGVDTVCPGAFVTFRDTMAAGGVWSSLHTSLATADSAGNITGVAGGVDTILYTVTNSCGSVVARKSITVFAAPNTGIISGDSTVCLGASVTLGESVSGGLWSSADSAVASIRPSGIVTANAVGVDTIMYGVSSAFCSATTSFVIRVEPLPVPGVITGSVQLCRADSTTLVDTAHGGAWSSLYDSVATVNSAGMVTGVSLGTTTISYIDTYNCGATYSTFSITIDTFPLVSIITGTADSLCPGDTLVLSDSIAGGTWSTMNAGIATVTAAGNVIGVATGLDSIKYTVSNPCGNAVVAYSVYVKTPGECTNSVKNIQLSTAGLSVYPNPSHGVFNIKYTGAGNELLHFTITNMVGEQVTTIDLPNDKETELNMAVSPGIYYISGMVSGSRVIQKVVVE